MNGRLHREKAKTGAVSASLAWNDPSDLDLEATVILEKGGYAKISYQNKQAAGGYLDVDMHARDGDEVDEPVENIFWKKPSTSTRSVEHEVQKFHFAFCSVMVRTTSRVRGKWETTHGKPVASRSSGLQLTKKAKSAWAGWALHCRYPCRCL